MSKINELFLSKSAQKFFTRKKSVTIKLGLRRNMILTPCWFSRPHSSLNLGNSSKLSILSYKDSSHTKRHSSPTYIGGR
jgi:hypothetical protein